MKNMILFTICLLLHVPSISTFAAEAGDAHKPHQHRHDRYAHMKNPVPMTVQSIAEGKRLYEKHCVTCHGEAGKGGVGPDLTDEVWIHGNADGEVYHVITDGVQGTAMKRFKDELSQESRWHLVNYLASLRSGNTGGR